MDDNYKSNIAGCIADIGFCNNCISVEEVNSSGQLTLLFTEPYKSNWKIGGLIIGTSN